MDFAVTFRDWASETTNYPNFVVEMALAHAIGDKVEAAYRRGDLLGKRQAAAGGVVEILHVAATGRRGAADAEASMKREEKAELLNMKPKKMVELLSMKPEEKAELRAKAALKVLRELLDAAKAQVEPIRWRGEGGPEFEDFVHALESGGQHPLLKQWENLKATAAAKRPAASLLDQNTRRLVVLLVESLVRAGLGKGAARKRASEALQRVLPKATTRAIKYWQAGYVLTSDDEWLIAQATEHHGHDLDHLSGLFRGLILYADNPIMAWSAIRRLPHPADNNPQLLLSKISNDSPTYVHARRVA